MIWTSPFPAAEESFAALPELIRGAPAELEAVLLCHPLVADVAVIPAPDAQAGGCRSPWWCRGTASTRTS